MAKAKETKITVQSMFKKSGMIEQESSEEKVIEVNNFVTQPAVIRYSASHTINLGNFESLKVEIGLDLPVYVEEIQTGFEAARNFVNRRISQIDNLVKSGQQFSFNDIELIGTKEQ